MASIFEKLFGSNKKERQICLVGEPNTGKSTLANRFSRDFTGKDEDVSPVSPVPHETTEITKLERIDFVVGRKKLDITLVDTPGIAQSVDFREFMKHGLTQNDAIQRAKEATSGIVNSIKFLKEVDLALVVMDATRPPFDQVSLTLLGTLESNNTKTLIVANKTDLDTSNIEMIKSTFPHIPVVPISALKGDGVDKLYNQIATVA
ncbi:MAG: 50S ribosome-binding GTPase [Candidatus Heimdallarchaeota archaeon]|nr:50S ribosome-binding GTPase [Candidatus Heimdallarchaeota archaeon]